jgi:general secretion pathway protein D
VRHTGLHRLTLLVTLWAQLAGGGLYAQVLPPGFNRPVPQQPKQQQPQQPQQPPTPAKPDPAKPDTAQPKPEASKPTQEPLTETQEPTIAPSPAGGLSLQNASLAEVIDILARQLKINYILDPRVKGGVTINTYGETKGLDNRALLDMILRINGAAMIQVGDFYRIVPLADVQRLPLQPETTGQPAPVNDQTMLNLIFLKYVTADELANLLKEFIGEGAKMWSYPPANLLMIQDSRRNMSRLMEIITLFDNDTFANQRVRLFDVKNSRPSDIASELESILKSISLSEKTAPVKFLAVDRINTLIAVAPNPGVFQEIEKWLKKLDIEVEASAGTVGNFVYRVRYGFAPTLAMAIMSLYNPNPYFGMGMMMGGYGMGMPGMGMPGGMGMYGGGMYGGGMGMYGGGMSGGGMYGGMAGGGMYGGGMYGGGMYPGMMMPYPGSYNQPQPGLPVTQGRASTTVPAPGTTTGTTADATGTYLGATPPAGQAPPAMPRIVPNPFDNTLLIQATRQEYESILKLLRQIDVPPRQVLIEAKIYEVDLTGALASGVTAYLRQRGGDAPEGFTHELTGTLQSGAMILSAGALVGQTRELLVALSASEISSKAKVISAPSVIATDSVPASINVGEEVPTLTAQAVTGAQEAGTSLFANSIQNRNSGVTLNVMARVNPTGIVTLSIQQEVSAPQAPDPDAAIQSPSFSKRTVQTQVTVQDGDTIAIGGIINERDGSASAGIPFLHRLPVVGAAFGSRSYTKSRTELIIFLTPRVIYDMNGIVDASEELKSGLKRLSREIRDF